MTEIPTSMAAAFIANGVADEVLRAWQHIGAKVYAIALGSDQGKHLPTRQRRVTGTARDVSPGAIGMLCSLAEVGTALDQLKEVRVILAVFGSRHR